MGTSPEPSLRRLAVFRPRRKLQARAQFRYFDPIEWRGWKGDEKSPLHGENLRVRTLEDAYKPRAPRLKQLKHERTKRNVLVAGELLKRILYQFGHPGTYEFDTTRRIAQRLTLCIHCLITLPAIDLRHMHQRHGLDSERDARP